MSTAQPTWIIVANLGDVDPVEYGGLFVFRDATGQYTEEAEWFSGAEDGEPLTVYRFSLDRLQRIEQDGAVYYVSERYRPDWPHPVHSYVEWFDSHLDSMASYIGTTEAEVRADLCSADPLDRAWVYRAIGSYLGFENLDSYPLQLTRAQANRRYAGRLRTLARRRQKGV